MQTAKDNLKLLITTIGNQAIRLYPTNFILKDEHYMSRIYGCIMFIMPGGKKDNFFNDSDQLVQLTAEEYDDLKKYLNKLKQTDFTDYEEGHPFIHMVCTAMY